MKINVVLTPQTDVVALTRYVAKKGTDIRFIEMMPVGEGHTNGVEPYKKVIGTLSKLDVYKRQTSVSGYSAWTAACYGYVHRKPYTSYHSYGSMWTHSGRRLCGA